MPDRSLQKARDDEKAAYAEVKSSRMKAGRVRQLAEDGVRGYEPKYVNARLEEIAGEEAAARDRLADAKARRERVEDRDAGIISMAEALKEFDTVAMNVAAARKLLLRLRAEVTVHGLTRALLEWYGAASADLCSPTVPLWPSG